MWHYGERVPGNPGLRLVSVILGEGLTERGFALMDAVRRWGNSVMGIVAILTIDRAG